MAALFSCSNGAQGARSGPSFTPSVMLPSVRNMTNKITLINHWKTVPAQLYIGMCRTSAVSPFPGAVMYGHPLTITFPNDCGHPIFIYLFSPGIQNVCILEQLPDGRRVWYHRGWNTKCNHHNNKFNYMLKTPEN